MNLLFFGAGASIPFYPSLTTDYITKELKKLCNWEYIIELYNETNNSKIDCTKIITLLKTIITTNPQANFEEICGFIDSITNILIDAERNTYDKYDRITDTLLRCKILELKLESISNIKYIPYLFRCLIVHIFLNVQKTEYYDELIVQQKEFINYFTSETNKSSIVSLNYDDILKDTIGEIYYNGFDKKQPSHMPFSCENFFHSKRTISYLHGCIRFFYALPDIQYSYENIPSIKDRLDKLVLQKSLNNQHLTSNLENHSYNVFITTGIAKNISMDYLPYNAYYTKFASDICKSSIIIIIGYSFKDHHVNRILSPFLNMNKENKIIIVDNNENNNLSINDLCKFGNILYDIYRVFLCEVPLNNNQEYNNINTIGYGFITDQILYYKNGYGKFLSEYKTIINIITTTNR